MLPPGTRIGNRYQIESLLGQGGMSNLYLARDFQFNGATRVIKEMTARYADPNEQKMAESLFMREAQLLATLNHPNIPKVFDKFTFQGKYYLSMEYVQGDDLGKRIQSQGRLPEGEVANYGAQMATVLYYLHRQNPPIVFRDVKPSNMMIQGSQVKLIDFGIARLFTPAKKGDTMRIGSPGYAPPEQYSGQTDPRSDIYALGVTMHHGLTGHDPTVSQTPFLLPPAKSLNPSLSNEMVSILERCTQLDPDKRYPSMLELKRDLQTVMRLHGMVVPGSSVPLHGTAPVGAAPPVATTAPPTSPPVSSPPTVAPTPAASPASPPTAGSPAPPAQPDRKPGKGRWLVAAFVLLVGGGGAVVTANNPSGAAALMHEVMQYVNPTLPADPGAAGHELYRRGGPLPLALDLLTQGVADKPGDPQVRIDWADACIASSGQPSWSVAVVFPEGQSATLRGLAMAQQDLNAVGGFDQKLVTVDWEQFAPGKAGAAVAAAAAGRLARRGHLDPPDAVLVCCSAEEFKTLRGSVKVPLFRVGPDAGDKGKDELPLQTVDWKEMLGQVQPGEPVWMAKSPAPPESIKGKGWPSGAEELAKLVDGQAGHPLVVEPSQLESLLKSPVKGGELKIVVLADDPAALPKVDEKPEALKKRTLQALVPGSRFMKSANGADFYALQGLYGDDPTFYDLSCRRIYDGLPWALGQLPLNGLTVRLDSEGKLKPPRYSLFQWNGSWTFLREVEGGKS